ncbi:hypothetical protein P4282_10620 [Bacillus swezeyi]|uniref:hypothetical protein n=1 Tax=Bacillus swezeyi TaxID=1925020 RepID=UPI002E22C6AE|nr:hypothetical protein [Bacillus swezeyi]
MKKAFVNFGVLLSLVVLVFAFSAPVNATETLTKEEKQGIERMQSMLSKMDKMIDAKLTSEYKKRVHEVLKSGKAKLDIDSKKLAFDKMQLIKTELDDGNYTHVVTLPVKLKDSHELSNVSFYFDTKGKFITSSEFYLTKNDSGNFQLTFLQDGKQQAKQDTDLKFETMAEYKDKIKLAGFDTDHLSKCLGISAALAATIASVCGVVCAITLGLGCVACAAGVMGFNFGGTAECLRQAWR